LQNFIIHFSTNQERDLPTKFKGLLTN